MGGVRPRSGSCLGRAKVRQQPSRARPLSPFPSGHCGFTQSDLWGSSGRASTRFPPPEGSAGSDATGSHGARHTWLFH